MLSTIQASRDPYFNLATEDFLLHERSEDFFILSVNDPSVIMGKHQVAQAEINEKATTDDGLPVLRRISGGGTVFHDHGNLNFAFIRQSEEGKQVDFRYYTQPVIEFLAHLGITAVFEGKNDLTFNGKKISGNAEHVFRERVLHHGTLLFDASLGNMKKYLRGASDCYSTRGVPSNRTTVINLKGILKGVGSMDELLNAMMSYFREGSPDFHQFSLTPGEMEKIRHLADERYRSWEWTWAYGPPYTFTNAFDISGKPHSCRLMVKDGIIWESDIYGSSELEGVAKSLIGCKHMFRDILSTLLNLGIKIAEKDVNGFF